MPSIRCDLEQGLRAIDRLKAGEMIGTDQHWRGFYTEKRPCLADLLLDSTLGEVSSLEPFGCS